MVSSCTVIGDATLDVSVLPSAAPHPGGDIPASISIGPGGQAANVAVRLARRGVGVRLLAPLADDAAGRWLADALRAQGVELVPLDAERTSSVVILIDADGERSMLSDRRTLPVAALAGATHGAAWIHLSAYPLLDDRGADQLAEVLGQRPGSSRLSVAGGSIPPDAAVVGRFRARLAIVDPDLVLVSLDEASALLGGRVDAPLAAAEGLRGAAPLVLVTAGSRGSAAATAASSFEVPSAAVDGAVVDATGAGDAYLATLLHGLEGDPWPPDRDALLAAMQAASLAGAQAARVLGAQAPIKLEDRTDGD